MKGLLMIIGVAAFTAGVLFAGQGLSVIRWPAESFMIGDIVWAYYGTGIATAGLIFIVLARR